MEQDRKLSENQLNKSVLMQEESKKVIGRHAVEELMEQGRNIEKIFLLRSIRGPFEVELRKFCEQHNVPLSYVEKSKLDKFSTGVHQGVIAFTSAITYQSVEQVVPFLFEQGINPKLVLLDQVTDVRNIGAIARSAEVFGFDALVVPTQHTALLNDVAIKASASALLNLVVCRASSLVNSMEYLKASGFHIAGIDVQGIEPINAIPKQDPLAIVMGSEGDGMRPHIKRNCSNLYKIDQFGSTQSLNVSVASGIVMYEVTKK